MKVIWYLDVSLQAGVATWLALEHNNVVYAWGFLILQLFVKTFVYQLFTKPV